MGLFGFSQPPGINKGIEEYQSTEGAVLLDVRNIGEYAQGHIEGSINIPLPCIIDIKDKVTDRNTPIFVYCLSGGRSAQAATLLNKMGYTTVKNIGGINMYTGKVVL